MKGVRTAIRVGWPPWLVWTIVLAAISSTEFVLMLVLPYVVPATAPRPVEATLDSVVLTVVVAPILWWTIVRPLRQTSELRSRFLSDLLAAIEDERRRIAVELHDGVGQSLTLLVSGLGSADRHRDRDELLQRCDDLQRIARRALQDTKAIARGLRPSLLDELGLPAALEQLAADVQQAHAASVTVDLPPGPGPQLPDAVQTALFRIVQESLANVVAHSGAAHACVRLALEPHAVVAEIRDDGRGLDGAHAAQGSAGAGHLGHAGMAERAALLGGTFAVSSGAGGGTTITVRLPLE